MPDPEILLGFESTAGPDHGAGRKFSAAVPLLRAAAFLNLAPRIPARRFFDDFCRLHLDQLAETERRLAPEFARTDAQFLSTGENLTRLSGICSEIVSQGERLLDLATGKERVEAAVAATMDLLEPPLAYIAGYPADAARVAQGTSRAERLARDILALEPALARTLEPLVFVRTLFQIESATLAADVKVMFAKLNGEIDALRNRVRDHFHAHFEELHRMQQVLIDATGEGRRRSETLLANCTARRAQLQHSLEGLQAAVQGNSVRHQGLEGVTRELGADIDRMVISMQAHDIVTQKLAHVRHGLEVVREESGRLTSGTLREAFDRLPNLAAIARIQAAQVRAAREQLTHAAASVRSAVDSALVRIQSVDEDCLMLREYGDVASTANGTIQALLDGIAETGRMIEEACCAAQASFEPLQPVGSAAASLTREMDHAGEDIRRIALNTQLLAVQHGEGTGLEVLAARTAAAAGEISDICSLAETRLAELTGDLQETLRGFHQIHAQGLEMRSALEQEGREREEALHGLRDATFTALAEVGALFETARAAAAEMKVADLDAPCRTLLPGIEAMLHGIAHRADLLCHALGVAHASPDLLRELASQYTMDSERQVHFASIEEDSPNSAGDAPPEALAAGAADLGENVELF